ncbi:MAG: hypothetical protein DMF63_13130 [Acidobacteria bacterium]|nr:MAG: hypothetical protein DMF63_13130 [Acidobacteriota bacterium]
MTIRKFSHISLLFAAFLAFCATPVLAKDQWLQVRSKNFYLIGNASEKDIRKTATKLEQFRETFKQVFASLNLTASVPTNVVVFKSDSAYKPYKPKRDDGKIDTFVAGYFQPGEDVNYITLSTGGTDEDTYGTIFHEYVHFIIDTNFGKSSVPAWFNEGLAEYYQTFQIEEDQKVKLGLTQAGHLDLLLQNKLMPLGTLFNISNHALLQHGDHSRSIFYAESWALIHYLVQSGKSAGLNKFLNLSIANKPAEQAFQEAFGIGYAQMEKDLRNYVAQSTYKYHLVTFKNKMTFETEMTTMPLGEAESNAYLGDLLYHVNRVDDAEPLLTAALAQRADLSMANATLGMVKLRQRKFAEARTYLEKAIAEDQKNHLALYRLAYLLSRDSRDEFGYVHAFDEATATKIRELLQRAIAVNPSFAESYELFAFVSLVTNDHLEEAATALKTALKYQPGNSRFILRIAEIYARQEKYKEAREIAARIASTADEPDLKIRAERLASEIAEREAIGTRNAEALKAYEARRSASGNGGGERVLIRRKPGEDSPTPEQIAKAEEMARLRAINHSLRPLQDGEKRVLGNISKIVCKTNVAYMISSGSETFTLTSKDFSQLTILTFVPDNGDGEVGCASNLANSPMVITYREAAGAKVPVRGELVALEFVPKEFRFVDLAAEPAPPTYVIEETGPPPVDGEVAQERRDQMMQTIRANIRQPAAGETRELGFIERSECTKDGMFFFLRTSSQTIRVASPREGLTLRAFTPDIESLQVGCGMKALDVPVVFIYKPLEDKKRKVSGDLISMEFVPKTFTIN